MMGNAGEKTVAEHITDLHLNDLYETAATVTKFIREDQPTTVTTSTSDDQRGSIVNDLFNEVEDALLTIKSIQDYLPASAAGKRRGAVADDIDDVIDDARMVMEHFEYNQSTGNRFGQLDYETFREMRKSLITQERKSLATEYKILRKTLQQFITFIKDESRTAVSIAAQHENKMAVVPDRFRLVAFNTDEDAYTNPADDQPISLTDMIGLIDSLVGSVNVSMFRGSQTEAIDTVMEATEGFQYILSSYKFGIIRENDDMTIMAESISSPEFVPDVVQYTESILTERLTKSDMWVGRALLAMQRYQFTPDSPTNSALINQWTLLYNSNGKLTPKHIGVIRNMILKDTKAITFLTNLANSGVAA